MSSLVQPILQGYIHMKISQGQTPCPCGNKKTFKNCCGPYIFGQQKPTHPEQLMRSRYSANAKKAYKYIATSWHAKNRPKKMTPNGKIHWLKLEIINTQEEHNQGWVEFKAYYSHNNQQHILHEKSFFIKEDDQWWYVNGDIIQQSG